MDLIILFIGIPICLFFSLLIKCYDNSLIKRIRDNPEKISFRMLDGGQTLDRLTSFLEAPKTYKVIQAFSILLIPIGIILLIFSREQYEEIGQILIMIGIVWGLLFLQVTRATNRLFQEIKRSNDTIL